MKSLPLQAPYSVERISLDEAIFVEKAVGLVLNGRPSAFLSRGIVLSPTAAAFRLNGRIILVEATGSIETNETLDFSVSVDAATCRADGDAPLLLALRAAEVLGIDDLRKTR